KPGVCALVAPPGGGRARGRQPRVSPPGARGIQLPPDHLSLGDPPRLQAGHADDRLAFRCCAALSGKRMKENIDRQAMTPRIMKPQKVSMGSSCSAPRQLMLRLSTNAAPPTPRLMASCCIM